MTDPANTLPRTAGLSSRGRPQQTPLGPRIRYRSTQSSNTASAGEGSQYSGDSSSGPASPVFPTHSSPARSDSHALPPISEAPPYALSNLPVPYATFPPARSSSLTAPVTTGVSPSPFSNPPVFPVSYSPARIDSHGLPTIDEASSPPFQHSHTAPATPSLPVADIYPLYASDEVPIPVLRISNIDGTPQASPHAFTIKSVPKSITLTPPLPIKFESATVPWKSLPLEAAMWTFTSQELQAIVSRAIRSSARESFIRLLSIDNLDNTLPGEVQRLTTQKAVIQSKYRFLVQRRTMLLQALNSSSGSKDNEDGTPVVSKLTAQLCQSITDCDRVLEELLQISDQLAQITKLMDVHWASALAIALRKLNGSYGRRTADLVVARERIGQLEAELEDAWKAAEKMAQEMDELDGAMVSDDEGEAVVGKAQIISLPQSPILAQHVSPSAGTILKIEPMSPGPHSYPLQNGLGMESNRADADVPDTVSLRTTRSARSIRSFRSTRSARSSRSMRFVEPNRLGSVTAAKTRSHRTSKSSLRLPNRKPSLRAQTPHSEEQPPMPDLPIEFIPSMPPISFANPSSSFLHFNSRNASTIGLGPRRTSLDDIQMMARPPMYSRFSYSTVDDINVRPQSTIDDIQVVPRTPVPVPLPHTLANNTAVDTIDLRDSGDHPVQNIPSIWLNADVPRIPTERIEPLMKQDATKTPYGKLKTLTKRYSMPFSLFSTKSTNPKSSKVRPNSSRSGFSGGSLP